MNITPDIGGTPAETLPSRSTVLQAGLAHLYTARQPEGAIADHHGESILAQGNRRFWFVPAGHRGQVHDGGPVVAVNVATPEYAGTPGADRRLTNPLAPGELDGLAGAIRSLGFEVTGTWNGTYETGSVGLAKPAHPSLLEALARYRRGCPQHGGTVFCSQPEYAERRGHAPCAWYRNGKALIVGPEDCVPEGFLCTYTGNTLIDRCDALAADGSEYCGVHREKVEHLDALVEACLAESAGEDDAEARADADPAVVAYRAGGNGEVI